MITFSSELIRTDITCIKTWEKYIFAGIEISISYNSSYKNSMF